jgi:hypothetical protein
VEALTGHPLGSKYSVLSTGYVALRMKDAYADRQIFRSLEPAMSHFDPKQT